MKLKRLYAFILTITLSLMFNLTVFASNSTEAIPAASDNISGKAWMLFKGKSDTHEFSEEQKAEMKTKYEAMKAKWNTLSQEQKEEIYKINDKSYNVKIELINKYLELGITDNETAAKMKRQIEEHKAKTRKNGELPRHMFKVK